jgi:hypothetical protein
MMRRLFWAAAGAVVGVAGYRRVSRLARTARAGDAVAFARDVRRGMDVYLERHHQPAGRNLGGPIPSGRWASDAASGGDPRRGCRDVDKAKGGR